MENTTVQVAATLATVIGTAVTAVATVLLWRVTRTLAVETTRMADLSGQPQVVAALRLNRWTMMYADLIVTNSGNATAFAIEVVFDPPLEHDEETSTNEREIPFQNVSLLRPGESLSSDIGKSYPLLERNYTVTTSWLRNPADTVRQTLTYSLSMADYKGFAQLGGPDPLVNIANEIKHIREDWRSVSQGQRHIKTDNYSSADRALEREEAVERRNFLRRQMERDGQTVSAPATETEPSLPRWREWLRRLPARLRGGPGSP